MKRLLIILIALSTLFNGGVRGGIPPAPNPPRLVNDFAGILTSEQIQEKEVRLVAFNDSTTNVVCVVTVNDLGGYTAAEFAYEIGEQWGVRSTDDKRNGVVLLLKPRNETSGEVYIAVGYDLEAAIPDAIAKRIIETKMMPSLREGDYNAAIDSALAYILPLAAGEISVERLYDDSGDVPEVIAALFFVAIIILVILYFSSKHKDGGNSNSRGGYYGGSFFPPSHYGGNVWTDYGGGYRGGGGFGGGGFGGGGAGGRF